MLKKPRAQNLRERIERTSSPSELDSDLQSHYNEVIRALQTIGPMESFSLLDPDSAKEAAKLCTARLEKLDQIQKQVKAVNTLLNQKKSEANLAVNNLPWPKRDL